MANRKHSTSFKQGTGTSNHRPKEHFEVTQDPTRAYPSNVNSSRATTTTTNRNGAKSEPEREAIEVPIMVRVYITLSSLLSMLLLIVTLRCPLNLGEDEIKRIGSLNQRQIFLLTIATMFTAGVVGACLSNIRRVVEHGDNFQREYILSYYLRPLRGGIAGLIAFFLLLGGAITLNIGSGDHTGTWMTLTGRAPYITFALLAGFASKEFTDKLNDIAESIFAVSDGKANRKKERKKNVPVESSSQEVS